MISCPNLTEGRCLIASELAKTDVKPSLQQCEFCTQKTDTPQGINKVTVSLAVKATKPESRKELLVKFRDILSVKPSGPGTELKKMISWFYSPDKKKCKCESRIAKMDAWGPDKCEENIDTIMRWLKHSAAINSVPYVESAVRVLVWIAIRKARKNV